MAFDAFIPGEIAYIRLRVVDLAGLPADPGSVVLMLKQPLGTVSSLTYGIGVDIIRDGVGLYHAEILLTASGLWAYRWALSAPNAGAAEGVINVLKSKVI